MESKIAYYFILILGIIFLLSGIIIIINNNLFSPKVVCDEEYFIYYNVENITFYIPKNATTVDDIIFEEPLEYNKTVCFDFYIKKVKKNTIDNHPKSIVDLQFTKNYLK